MSYNYPMKMKQPEPGTVIEYYFKVLLFMLWDMFDDAKMYLIK